MNLIYNASAGTGKTFRVTELYTALVLGTPHKELPDPRDPVDPGRILLMTFTDNAATELRSGVSSKVIAVEKDALDNNQSDRADCARRVLRALPSAKISTIHAFCAGLLREHALELGLSPSFQTLEDEAQIALLDDVLKTELFERLETQSTFRDFCAALSVLGDQDFSVIGTLRTLLEQAASRGLDVTQAEKLLPPVERTIGKIHFEAIRDELKGYDLPDTAAKALTALNNALQDFPNRSLIAAIPKFGQAKKVKYLSDKLAEVKETFLIEQGYEQTIDQFRAFAQCLAACSRKFIEAKRARDQVDFGDLLLMARDFLKQKQQENSTFDWIIVDEVQDTSRIQCELIESLWSDTTNLVICGDKKQSIYSWRSADPQVMSDLEKQMEARGEAQKIALKESYRSKDRVIDAVNALFDGVYGPEYNESALEPVEKIGAITEGEGPCVEYLTLDDESSTVDDEMAAIARRIRLLVAGDASWRPRFRHNGQRFVKNEPFRFGDILILLKRLKYQPILEKALRDAGIPYTSGGKGRALFEQQEVRDILLFLQVLCEPLNDLALVGFLRSPFAGVSDEELVQWSRDGEQFDREILRRQFFASGHPSAERLLRYRSQIGLKLPSQLVREMVRETAVDAYWAGQPGGPQRLANLKKVLDWLRATERGGQALLQDCVRRFEIYIKTPPLSGAAEALTPDPDQNAVKLMTVHGSKGLTARVCIIPDSSFKDPIDQGFAVFSVDHRLQMKRAGLDGDEVKTPGWDTARKADQEVRKTEMSNLFYVAMTRARDLVIFSGAGRKKIDGWVKLADSFIQNAPSELLCRRRFADIPELNIEVPVEVDNGNPLENWMPLNVPSGLERKSVSSLGEMRGSDSAASNREARLFGTVGHAVLEELAKTKWQGDLEQLVDLACAEFGEVNRETLIQQLERVRELLRKETAGAIEVQPEYPFVLKRGSVLLDGTIDLLVRYPDQIKVFDYKWTAQPADRLVETYRYQWVTYLEAVRALHPGQSASAGLVRIADSIELHYPLN